MSSPAALPPLSQLDHEQPASLDPVVWSGNLDALSREAPDFAKTLRETSLPDTWRPVLALDESRTYRTEPPGQPPTWLGHTAAPRTRARGMLQTFDAGGQNVALPCAGAGAELTYLLEKLPAHIAVFLFEPDIYTLAAILRLHDLSHDIAAGRCILLPPEDQQATLERLLAHHLGLMSPANILLPDLVPPTQVQSLRTLCENVGREVTTRRAAELQALKNATPAKPAPPAARPRVAILSLGTQRSTHATARQLEQAVHRLGGDALCRAVQGPRDVLGLTHCQALRAFTPQLTICAGHLPNVLPVRPPGICCAWFLTEQDIPAELPDDGTLYLAASPRIAQALRRAAPDAHAVIDWFWACEPTPEPSPDTTPDEVVVLVGNLLDARPQTYRVDQTTHRRLWEHVRKITAKEWQTPRILRPQQLLVRAERESGIKLTESSLRETMVSLIERVLIPAVVLEQIAARLAKGPPTLTLGTGWGRLSAPNRRPLADDLAELHDLATVPHPRACIVAGHFDPLQPAVLHAAASGWPLLLHALGGRPLTPQLGNVLQPKQHVETFADADDLLRSLESIRDASRTSAKRVARARHHVLANHTYDRRLENLLAHVRTDFT